MRQMLSKWWKGYKYRFVPWIVFNVKHHPSDKQLKNIDQQNIKDSKCIPIQIYKDSSKFIESDDVPVAHVSKADDSLISDSELVLRLLDFYKQCHYPTKFNDLKHLEEVSQENEKVMGNHFGFTIKRCKSVVSPDAGTGVFITSGVVKAGSIVALYPGTIYMPFEPLLFPSIGNPYIFRCSDGIHIDGNDKWISKSIFKSCAARDRFDYETPCCDISWLTSNLISPLNIGQYVNNQSKTQRNNVVYQESQISLPSNMSNENSNNFPITLFKYLPNVWSDPKNNRFGLKVISLIAVQDIQKGEEILSSYFTVVHPDENR